MVVAQNKPVTGVIRNDEKTMREIMGYLKTEDHDFFVRYIKTLGIRHDD
jgi:hypothetical protein